MHLPCGLIPCCHDVRTQVFAYGQTGTGKTHTMEGELRDDQLKGVIPRSVDAIFEQLKKDKYTSSTVTASYLEIYNEELSDLLHVQDAAAPAATPRAGFGNKADSDAPKLQLVEEAPKKKDTRGSVFVKNLSEHRVSDPSEVLNLISRAQDKRKIGETQMNKKSSRSHCVFTLSVVSTRVTMDGSSMECTGRLHLVDLAGSECAKTAGGGESGKGQAGEARERERKNINQSLLTLGRVISTLKECMEKKIDASAVRIPYRDSKLTRLLQESLGGRCKTVIIATLSPSVLAVDETFSTLNYAQQAHGIQNKPVATSYVKVAMNGGASNPSDSKSGGDGSGATIQDWNEMQCKLAYMQSQVEEAQSSLARKVREQEQIVKQKEAAEAEKAVALEALEKERIETERLTAECAKHEAELKVAAFMLSTRAATEQRLGAQAKNVLSNLTTTEAEAANLHATLASAAEAIDAQSARRGAFSASLHVQLQQAQTHVTALGNALSEERSAMLAAATKAETTIVEHAASMAKHAATMAGSHADESGRAAAALAAVQASATSAVHAACAELSAGVNKAASRAASAQGAIAAQLDGVVAAMTSAQSALSEGIDTAVGRQAAAEEEAASQRASMASAVATNAADIGARLAAEAKRFGAHSGALRVLLTEVGEAKNVEAYAREAIATLIATETADGAANVAKMQAAIDAIGAAVDAQNKAQPDASVNAALKLAGSELAGARDSTTSTLSAQQAALAAAVDAQNAGNASAATTAALEKARAGVEASGAARLAEVDSAAKKLAAQKDGLQAMLNEQSTLRAALLEQVMGAVEQTLSKQLSALADKTGAAIAAACTTSDDIGAVGASSAAATKHAVAAYAAESEALVSMCTGWGASNDDVAGRMAEAKAESVKAAAGLAAGAEAVDASHATASGLIHEWAAADETCRDALASTSTMQGESMSAASEATIARVSSIRAIDATAEKLEKMSDAASAQLVAAGADVDAGVIKVTDAHQAGDAAAAKIDEAIGVLGASSAAARKTEAAALAAINSAAADATSAATATLGEATAKGNTSAAELKANAATQAEAATALATAQGAQWTAFADGEGKARKTADDVVSQQRDLASGEANLHTHAVVLAKEAREAASTAAAASHDATLATQAAGVDGMRSAVDTFTSDSTAEPPHVPERGPQPFTEGFATTPAEDAIRAHYEATGGAEAMAQTFLEVELAEAVVGSPTPARRSSMSKPTPRSSIKRASLVDGAALRALTVPQLKSLCDEHDVSKEGKKEELVQRLTDKGAKPPSTTPGRTTPRRAKSDPNVPDTENDAPVAKKPLLTKQVSAPAGGPAGAGKIAKGTARRSANETRKEVSAM